MNNNPIFLKAKCQHLSFFSGVGRTAPDPSASVTLDGVQVPLGKGTHTNIDDTSLLYNEYPFIFIFLCVILENSFVMCLFLLRNTNNYLTVVCSAQSKRLSVHITLHYILVLVKHLFLILRFCVSSVTSIFRRMSRGQCMCESSVLCMKQLLFLFSLTAAPPGTLCMT